MGAIPTALGGRHLLRIADWQPDELRLVLDLALELKHGRREGGLADAWSVRSRRYVTCDPYAPT